MAQRRHARLFTLVSCALVTLTAAAAQPEPGAPIDPERLVTNLRKSYSGRPFVESMEVSAESAGQRRRETVIVRGSAKGEMRIELGDLILWTDGPALRAVHRLNAGVYAEFPLDDADRAASIIAALPPLPVPQLGLALQPRDARPSAWPPLPLCSPVHWDGALLTSVRGRPGAALTGTGETCTTRVITIGDPPRLVAISGEVRSPDGAATTLRSDIIRLDEPVGRLDADLRGRTKVPALTDLIAATDDARPGLACPELIAQPLGETETNRVLPTGSPAVILLIARVSPEIDAAAKACSTAAGSAHTACRAVAVSPITDSTHRSGIVRLARTLQPKSAFISYSPRTTIDRFASGSPGVAVVTDATGLIAAVVPLTDAQAAEKIRVAIPRPEPVTEPAPGTAPIKRPEPKPSPRPPAPR